ncbi:4804_t:CDS:2 [Ambispora leptoticha]|uniref:4804_t:CDS:1 n=1 Tax=Ambispora leptoticha TaxID=144679 RepID=A0A9N8WV49_9GLOM|nr:4804_t:CDS:2 [Ambispora leptoticha]
MVTRSELNSLVLPAAVAEPIELAMSESPWDCSKMFDDGLNFAGV